VISERIIALMYRRLCQMCNSQKEGKKKNTINCGVKRKTTHVKTRHVRTHLIVLDRLLLFSTVVTSSGLSMHS
jgi:hypothetical protein